MLKYRFDVFFKICKYYEYEMCMIRILLTFIVAFSHFVVTDQYGFEDDGPPDCVDCVGVRDSRTIFINDVQPYKNCSNRISTAKYSILSFMPIFLFEQFRRYSNCFFLLIVLLQVRNSSIIYIYGIIYLYINRNTPFLTE